MLPATSAEIKENLGRAGRPERDKQNVPISAPGLVRDVPLLSQAPTPGDFGWGPRTSPLPGTQGGVSSGGWGVGSRSSREEWGSRRLPDLPYPRQHRYLPACGRRAAPGLRAPTQAAAGRARRGLRLAPPNFPSPSVGRGDSGGGQAERYEARSPKQEARVRDGGSCATQPQRASVVRAPRAPNAEGRAGLGRQSPLAPTPAQPEPRPQPTRGRGARI